MWLLSRLLCFANLVAFQGLVGVHVARAATTFKWPDPRLDFEEGLLYAEDPENFKPFSLLTAGCASRQSTTVAAQWLRIAYHDMSTHNITDGSGGLDASIALELDGAQNIGEGMVQSLLDFDGLRGPYVPLADIIAMGAVLAVASCGGPVIPYRAGRRDAKEAGPATVPEPQDSLESHIASFKNQGFTQEEMIALVACGHTFGGVRHDDFPLVVNVDVENGFGNFDGTSHGFDHIVVSEYLQGTTTNPLVVGANVTTRSDLRIFSSDKNATMKRLADPATFQSTCATLLERMINTVPKGVTLTEIIDPIENKARSALLFTKDGHYLLQTSLRRLTVNEGRTVKLFWKERTTEGSLCPSTGCTVLSSKTSTVIPTFLGELRGLKTLASYEFAANIPLNASVSKFWFEVDEQDGSSPTVVDNGGSGFVIDQDTVLFDPVRTTVELDSFRIAVVVSVKDSSTSSNASQVTIESFQSGTIDTVTLQLDTNHPPADGYRFFTGKVQAGATGIHVKAVIGGQNFTQYVGQTDLSRLLVRVPVASGALSIRFSVFSPCFHYICLVCIFLILNLPFTST
ncbi:heme peroxidase [Lyophyllum atratum]|nr:heme peroxidase [Lyophyllum atratum]